MRNVIFQNSPLKFLHKDILKKIRVKVENILIRESWTNIGAFQNGLVVQEIIFPSQKRQYTTHDRNGIAMPYYTYTIVPQLSKCLKFEAV